MFFSKSGCNACQVRKATIENEVINILKLQKEVENYKYKYDLEKEHNKALSCSLNDLRHKNEMLDYQRRYAECKLEELRKKQTPNNMEISVSDINEKLEILLEQNMKKKGK